MLTDNTPATPAITDTPAPAPTQTHASKPFDAAGLEAQLAESVPSPSARMIEYSQTTVPSGIKHVVGTAKRLEGKVVSNVAKAVGHAASGTPIPPTLTRSITTDMGHLNEACHYLGVRRVAPGLGEEEAAARRSTVLAELESYGKALVQNAAQFAGIDHTLPESPLAAVEHALVQGGKAVRRMAR